MFEQETQSDGFAAQTLNAEIDTHAQESILRLQYMIAFLIEKNEQIRQELAAKRSSESLGW
jgi:hypothetical protein